jgi:hypothetical protein
MLVLDMQGVIREHTSAYPGHKIQPGNRALYTRNMQKSIKNHSTFGQNLPYIQSVLASTIDVCPRWAVCLVFFIQRQLSVRFLRFHLSVVDNVFAIYKVAAGNFL